MSKWIAIELKGKSESGKTNVWAIRNLRTQERVGEIRWYGGFRKYAFYPEPPEFEGQWILYDAQCLQMIASKLDEVNKAHKTKHGK